MEKIVDQRDIERRQRLETGLRMSSAGIRPQQPVKPVGSTSSAIGLEGVPDKLNRAGRRPVLFELVPEKFEFEIVKIKPISEQKASALKVIKNDDKLDPRPEVADLLRFFIWRVVKRGHPWTERCSLAVIAIDFFTADELESIYSALPRAFKIGQLFDLLTGESKPLLTEPSWQILDMSAFDYDRVEMTNAYYSYGAADSREFIFNVLSEEDQVLRLFVTVQIQDFGPPVGSQEIILTYSISVGSTVISFPALTAAFYDTECSVAQYYIDFTLPGSSNYSTYLEWSNTGTSSDVSVIFSTSFGKARATIPQPVIVTNTEPIWTTNIAPIASPRMPSRIKRVERGVVLINEIGPQHAKTFKMTTMIADKTVSIIALNKRQGFATLRTKVEAVYGPTDIQWHESSSVRDYEANVHNKEMHTLNGNMFKFSTRKAIDSAFQKAEQEALTITEATQIAKDIARTVTLEEDSKVRTLSWKELFGYFSSFSGDAFFVHTATQCTIYALCAAFPIDQEFLDHLESLLCDLQEVFSTQEVVIDESVLRGDPPTIIAAKPVVAKKRDPYQTPRSRPDQKSRDTIPTTSTAPEVIAPKDFKTLIEQRSAVVKRIAAKIPDSWQALAYLVDSPHSRQFKRMIWEKADISDVVREFGNCILDSNINVCAILAYNFLGSSKQMAFMEEGLRMDLARLIEVVATIPDFGSVREVEANRHNKLMHILYGNIVRACEAKAHNRLMHALNGNTTMKDRRSFVDIVMSSIADVPHIDPIAVMTTVSNVPGLGYSPLADYSQSGNAQLGIVSPVGAFARLFQRIPIYHSLFFIAPPAVPAGGPVGFLTFVDVVQMKGETMPTLTPVGTALLETATKNNGLLVRADNKSYNGYYAVDLVNLVQLQPLYDCNMESMMLKWLLLYDCLCHDALPQNKLWEFTDPLSDYQLDPALAVVTSFNGSPFSGNNAILPGVAPLSAFDPYTGVASLLAIHLTVQTVPPGAKYWFLPPALISAVNPVPVIVAFLALIANFPCGMFNVVTTSVAAVVREMPNAASRFFVPGESLIHLILPSNGAERPPTTQAEANRFCSIDMRYGNVATASTPPGGAQMNVNYIGAPAVITYNINDFFHSWFNMVINWPNIMTTLLTRLKAVFPIEAPLHAMYDIYISATRTSTALLEETLAAPPAFAGLASGNSYVDHMMRERIFYDAPAVGAGFDSAQVRGKYIPSYLIHAMDFQSFNIIATGLWDQKNSLNYVFDMGIGRPLDFISFGNFYALPFMMAGQLFYAGLGLSSVALENLVGQPGALPCYIEELTNVFTSRQLMGSKLMPAPASELMLHIAANIMGFKPYSVNNGLAQLSIYDRYMFNGERWAGVWYSPAPAVWQLDRDWVPAVFPDFWYELLAKEVPLRLSLPDQVWNGFGATGFELPNAVEIQAAIPATSFPLMSDVFIKRNDPDNEALLLDDKTLWNSKLRVLADFEGLTNNFDLYDVTGTLYALPPLRALPHMGCSATQRAGITISYSSASIPARTSNGFLLLAATVNALAANVSRRYDLGNAAVALSTVRVATKPTAPAIYRQSQKPVKTMFPVTKIAASLKDVTPAAIDPAAGTSGNL